MRAGARGAGLRRFEASRTGVTAHCPAAPPPGWCIFNDLAVAARAAQRDAGVGQVLFVDLDTHQGDGTVRTPTA